jgi:O6-methylguanine-DNA--protein-cysteine methyltransferase
MSGYYPAGSMMGSGIYSTTITREIVCREYAETDACDNIFTEDFETDDWGNVEQEVLCIKCGTTFTYREERDYD